MAHFAQLDENNIVTRVVVIDNNSILDDQGKESEEKGINLCRYFFGSKTTWVQTSYSGSFRRRFAGPGQTYDKNFDAFIDEKIFPSWVLNQSTLEWDPPVPFPSIPDEEKGKYSYEWDEGSQSWVKLNIEAVS